MGTFSWRIVAPAAIAATLALGACGSDDAFDESSDDANGATVVVGGANFTEMQVMQALYAELLGDAGFDVEMKTADQREVYFPALEAGSIDVVPEYAATVAEYLNRSKNGDGAETVATSDVETTVDALATLTEDMDVVFLEPADAASQNGFAVTKEFAEANNLTTLSDLAALNQDITLAAVEECDTRPFCKPGLEETYGLTIVGVMPTGFSSLQTKEAVSSGQAQLGLVGTTDGTLEDAGLVALEDDKGLQLADNLIPAVNAEFADNDALKDALNKLSDELTTDELRSLNLRVDQDREKAEDVAKDWLEEKDLI